MGSDFVFVLMIYIRNSTQEVTVIYAITVTLIFENFSLRCDCTAIKKILESLSANTKIFRDIANEIAKPLRRNDSALAYLPTQFITEFIKSNGYAGVAYTSTMRTEGINVAVFDESIFECVAVHTVEINNISYSYEKITYGQQK